MAACQECGTKAGLGKKLCEPCSEEAAKLARQQEREREARVAEQQRLKREAAEESKRQAEIARQQRLDAYIAGRMQELHDLVDQGVEPCLYDVIVISTQSTRNRQKIGNPPDLDEIRRYGYAGWEAVGIIPSTYGEGLLNESFNGVAESWGGGIGGLVVGAYILLRFTITKGVLEKRKTYLGELLARDFPG